MHIVFDPRRWRREARRFTGTPKRSITGLSCNTRGDLSLEVNRLVNAREIVSWQGWPGRAYLIAFDTHIRTPSHFPLQSPHLLPAPPALSHLSYHGSQSLHHEFYRRRRRAHPTQAQEQGRRPGGLLWREACDAPGRATFVPYRAREEGVEGRSASCCRVQQDVYARLD